MKYWLFQGNPDQFDIDAYLKSSEKIYWSISVQKYQKEISLGDIVYLWRAKGKSKKISGVVAKTTVIEECKPKYLLNNPTWLYDNLWAPNTKEKSDFKVGLSVENFRLTPNSSMITSEDFMSDSILRESKIIKVRVGSNFPLSVDEFNRINNLWESENDSIKYEGKEGKILHRVHQIRERDQKLKEEFMLNFLKKHKKLFCELCGLDPKKIYNELGETLLEVHHIVPLNKLSKEVLTKISDLLLVCPNCHRAIHKGDAEQNLFLLKKIFKDVGEVRH